METHFQGSRSARRPQPETSIRSGPIRKFALYGQPPTTVEQRFLSYDDLGGRAGPGLVVNPHTHDELSHLLIVTNGAGILMLDERAVQFAGPCIISVPHKVVHWFRFDTPVSGGMLTFASALVRKLGHSDGIFDELLLDPFVIKVEPGSRRERFMAATVKNIADEMQSQSKCYRSVLEMCLASLLIVAARTRADEVADPAAWCGRDIELVASFRDLVEANFIAKLSLPDYARLLRVTPARLRKSCARVRRLAPLQIIQERVLVESKRLLLYTGKTVAEIAYTIGFDDPAYFSRFFSGREGVSPSDFRKRHTM